MVTQNKMRTCAPISDLPSNISTMISDHDTKTSANVQCKHAQQSCKTCSFIYYDKNVPNYAIVTGHAMFSGAALYSYSPSKMP